MAQYKERGCYYEYRFWILVPGFQKMKYVCGAGEPRPLGASTIEREFPMKPSFRSAFLLMVGISLWVPAASQDYYPLGVGNSWYYRSIYEAPGDSTIFSSFRVIGDSLFPNGHRYFVLDSVDIMQARFVRMDTASVCYLNPSSGQDMKVFNLNAKLGDTTYIQLADYYTVALVAIDTFEVLGVADHVLTYRLDGLVSPSYRRLSRRFGPLYEERFYDGPPPWPYYGRQLVGCTIGGTSYGKTVHVIPELGHVPTFALHQNFPNPFNPATQIEFSLGSAAEVSLSVSDIIGRHVCWLVSESKSPGRHSVSWDGRDDRRQQLSSGVYFYELRIAGVRQVRRMLLLK